MLLENEKWKNQIWGAKVLLLAGFVFCLFFIAEHNLRMSTVENFVLDIELQESWASGGNSMRRIAFLGCAGLGAVGLMMGQWGRFRWNVPMVLFVAYLAWAGASVAWSIDPSATVRRYILMICCAIGCFGVSRFLSMEQVILAAVITTLGWFSIGLMAEIAFGAFRPHQGDYRFAGTLHPNLQATNLAILCLSSFTMAKTRPKFKWLFYGILAGAFCFLILTKCRTITAVLPFSIGVIWFVTQPAKQVVIGSMAGLWFVSACILGFLVIGFDPLSEYSELLLLGRSEETGSSLTGRLPLWKDLSNYIVQRPWHGYGFGAFWTPRNIYDIALGQEWVISEAHSSYVDSALQVGLIGALLMIGVAVSTFFLTVAIYRRTHKPEYMFVIGGVVLCLIRGLTESGMGGPSGFSSSLILVMAAHSWNAPSQNDASDELEQSNTNLQVSSSSGAVVYE